MISPFYLSPTADYRLFQGDSLEILPQIEDKVDAIFADPPYFLSNGGLSVSAGKPVCVDKGAWDVSQGRQEDLEFNYHWLEACRKRLTESGTIWICGTYHNIFTVANVLSELDYRILNAVTWQKTNPPPNLSCRFFTHSTEVILWARKSKKVPHYYNYDLMRKLAGGRQMTDVWRMPAIAPWEKSCGKHPTQKPLALMVRALLASTKENALVLDPFAGSGSTGIAANLIGRRFIGVEREQKFIEIAVKRRVQMEEMGAKWATKIKDISILRSMI